MFKFIVRLTLVLRMVLPKHAPSSKPANLLTWESCSYGDTIENPCNKCVCTSKEVYDCEPKDCLPIVLEVYPGSEKSCHPNTIYNRGSISCICTARAQWPHKTCHDTFSYLPENSITKNRCKPNGYFRVDCNVCRCNSIGEVDTKRCTHNVCDEKPIFRTSSHRDTSNLFGTCLVKNWYSSAPCQFCYCIDTNKLICSTSLNNAHKENEITLGKNNLVLCGPELLTEAAALVPSLKSYRNSSQIGRLLPTDYPDVRSYNDTEETSKQTKEDDDRDKVNDNLSLAQWLKDVKVNEDNDDPDEDDANQIVQRSSAVKKEAKTKDIMINLAASIDANPNKLSQRLRDYDALDVLRKILSSRRGLKFDVGIKCKPGSAITIKCNICHCLKNGKMLCTNKKCY